MNYLVTGGTGLIGSRIVRDLVKGGGQVVAYDLYPEGSFLHQMLSDEEKQRVKIVRGDMTDLPNLIHICQDNQVEKVFHLASLLSEAAKANPPLALKVMAEGTLNIFEVARMLGLKKVVWASSCSVFGPPEMYAEEYIPNDAPHYPYWRGGGIYPACKSFCENLALNYIEEYGVDISAIRYGVVYGPMRYGGASFIVTRELIEKPAAGEPGVVPFGDDSPNWLYADDAARATILASKAVMPKTKAYSISSDIRSIKEVADYVRKLLPDADITLLPGLIGMHFKYDTTPIKEELGFEPEWPIERAVKDMINTVRKQCGLPLV